MKKVQILALLCLATFFGQRTTNAGNPLFALTTLFATHAQSYVKDTNTITVARHYAPDLISLEQQVHAIIRYVRQSDLTLNEITRLTAQANGLLSQINFFKQQLQRYQVSDDPSVEQTHRAIVERKCLTLVRNMETLVVKVVEMSRNCNVSALSYNSSHQGIAHIEQLMKSYIY